MAEKRSGAGKAERRVARRGGKRGATLHGEGTMRRKNGRTQVWSILVEMPESSPWTENSLESKPGEKTGRGMSK